VHLVASRRDAGATDVGSLDFVPIRWQARTLALPCVAPAGSSHMRRRT